MLQRNEYQHEKADNTTIYIEEQPIKAALLSISRASSTDDLTM